MYWNFTFIFATFFRTECCSHITSRYSQPGLMWWIPVLYTKIHWKAEVGADVWEVRMHHVLETLSWPVLRRLFALFLSRKVQSGLTWIIFYFWKDNSGFCMVGIFLSLKLSFHEASTVWHSICSSCVWTETILGWVKNILLCKLIEFKSNQRLLFAQWLQRLQNPYLNTWWTPGRWGG